MPFDGLRNFLKRTKEEKAQKQTTLTVEDIVYGRNSPLPSSLSTSGFISEKEHKIISNNCTADNADNNGSPFSPIPCRKEGEGGGSSLTKDKEVMRPSSDSNHELYSEGKHISSTSLPVPSSSLVTASSLISTLKAGEAEPATGAIHPNQVTSEVGHGWPNKTRRRAEEDEEKEENSGAPLDRKRRKAEREQTREEVNGFRKRAMKGLEASMSTLGKAWEVSLKKEKRNPRLPLLPSLKYGTSSCEDSKKIFNRKDDHHNKDDGNSNHGACALLLGGIPKCVCTYCEELLEVEFGLQCSESGARDTLKAASSNSKHAMNFFRLPGSTSFSSRPLPQEEALLLLALCDEMDSCQSAKQRITSVTDGSENNVPKEGDSRLAFRSPDRNGNEGEKKVEWQWNGEEDIQEGVKCGLCLTSSIPTYYVYCAELKRRACLLQCMWFLLAAQWRAALGGKGLSSSLLHPSGPASMPATTEPYLLKNNNNNNSENCSSPLLVVDSAGERIEGWSYAVYRYLYSKSNHSVLHDEHSASRALQQVTENRDEDKPLSQLSTSSCLPTFPTASPQQVEERIPLTRSVREESRTASSNIMEELTSLPVRRAVEQWLEEERWRQHGFKLLALVYHDLKVVESNLQREWKKHERENLLSAPPSLDGLQKTCIQPEGAPYPTLAARSCFSATSESDNSEERSSNNNNNSRATPFVLSKWRGEVTCKLPVAHLTQGCVFPSALFDGLYHIIVVHLQKQKLEACDDDDVVDEGDVGNSVKVDIPSPHRGSPGAFSTAARCYTPSPFADNRPGARHSMTSVVTAARQAYNNLTLGNANWKLGLFSGGEVHMRRSMEKVERNRVYHLLNNEKALTLLHVVHLWISFYEKGLPPKFRKWFCTS